MLATGSVLLVSMILLTKKLSRVHDWIYYGTCGVSCKLQRFFLLAMGSISGITFIFVHFHKV